MLETAKQAGFCRLRCNDNAENSHGQQGKNTSHQTKLRSLSLEMVKHPCLDSWPKYGRRLRQTLDTNPESAAIPEDFPCQGQVHMARQKLPFACEPPIVLIKAILCPCCQNETYESRVANLNTVVIASHASFIKKSASNASSRCPCLKQWYS